MLEEQVLMFLLRSESNLNLLDLRFACTLAAAVQNVAQSSECVAQVVIEVPCIMSRLEEVMSLLHSHGFCVKQCGSEVPATTIIYATHS